MSNQAANAIETQMPDLQSCKNPVRLFPLALIRNLATPRLASTPFQPKKSDPSAGSVSSETAVGIRQLATKRKESERPLIREVKAAKSVRCDLPFP
jgi:hypothetical protein